MYANCLNMRVFIPVCCFLTSLMRLAGHEKVTTKSKRWPELSIRQPQCLDEFEGDSILVAATNLEIQLDHAIWRRFDTKMTYAMPDEDSRRLYISKLVGTFERENSLEDYISTRLAGLLTMQMWSRLC